MGTLIISACVLAVVIRGLIINQKRERLYKRYIKNIIQPMEYVVNLQKEGFFQMLYVLDDSKNISYIDTTFSKSLAEREDFIKDYTSEYTWKCFLWNSNLSELKNVYEYMLPIYQDVYNCILLREKMIVADMMKLGCKTWEEYLKIKTK